MPLDARLTADDARRYASPIRRSRRATPAQGRRRSRTCRRRLLDEAEPAGTKEKSPRLSDSPRSSIVDASFISTSAAEVPTMWPPPLSETPLEFEVKPRTDGKRIDAYLASRFTDYSRRVIQKIIDAEAVLVNGRPVKASYRVRPGDRVSIRLPELPDMTPEPEDIPIEVVYEDDALDRREQAAGDGHPPGQGQLARDPGQRAPVPLRHALDARRREPAGDRPSPRPRHDGPARRRQGRPGPPQAGRSSSSCARSTRNTWRWSTGVPQRDSDYIERPIGFHPTVREKMAIRDRRGRRQGRGDVLRGRRAVPRLRPGALQAADRPHPPDPHPPHPHRPPDPGRQALLGAGPDHPGGRRRPRSAEARWRRRRPMSR